MARSDVLLVDFDLTYTTATQLSLEGAGASVAICLAEQLTVANLKRHRPRSILLAASCLDSELGRVPQEVLFCGLPVLGICNGAQILALALGGRMSRLSTTELGVVRYSRPDRLSLLQQGLPRTFEVAMAHDFVVKDLPPMAAVTGVSDNGEVAAFECWRGGGPLFGFQFHPEDPRTQFGSRIFINFVRLARIHAALVAAGFAARALLPTRSRRGNSAKPGRG